MAVQLSADELREVVLAIDAYRQALERHNSTGSVGSCIRALESARLKLNRECLKADGAAAPARWRAASE